MSQRINLLEDEVINTIAAGEVVERPASVVKELIENAIDANSNEIIIEIEDYGIKLIKIIDNGEGMNADDAVLSLERHATSKIKDINDLFSIGTLGFRGEALPSISAVSKLEIITKDKESSIGQSLIIFGGKIKTIKETACKTGTSISVRDLFYNVPARKKFLKTPKTEWGHINSIIVKMILTNPGVSFRVFKDGVSIYNVSRNMDLKSRMGVIYTNNLSKALYDINYSDDICRITGLTSQPHFSRGNSHGILLTVNGRIIKSNSLNRAIWEGYGTSLVSKHYPYTVLNITCPYELVDVNVHPNKTEVKFSKSFNIFESVRASISDSISGKKFYKSIEISYPSNKESNNIDNENLKKSYSDNSKLFKDEIIQQTFSPSTTLPVVLKDPGLMEEEYSPDMDEIENLKILGQFFNKYIIAYSSNFLYLIDQHAAHEKILYEYYLGIYSDKQFNIQTLLNSFVLTINPLEYEIIIENAEKFYDYGFIIEDFGKNTVALSGIPNFLNEKDAEAIVVKIIESLLDNKKLNKNIEARFMALVTMSCKKAIKAGQSMNITEMETLLKRLAGIKNPFTCPHGRPVIINFGIKEIDRWFLR